MQIDLDSIATRSASKQKVRTQWRTFTLDGNKVRLLVKNIGCDSYRIAQERLIEQLRANMHNLTSIDEIEETQFAKQMRIVAYHLVEGWEGIVDKATQQDVPFSYQSLGDILVYGGEVGIRMHAWILIQATAIQQDLDKELDSAVGKPYTFTVTTEKTSEENELQKLDDDLVNQLSENP